MTREPQAAPGATQREADEVRAGDAPSDTLARRAGDAAAVLAVVAAWDAFAEEMPRCVAP